MRVLFLVGCVCTLHTLSAQRLTSQSFQAVNSSYDELDPVVSPDGRSLYITVANHPQNIGGKKDPGDIWVSVLTETGQWSAPIHAGTTINDRGYNAVAGFSADGNQLILVNHYDASGATARTQGIAVSRSTGGNGWSRPENISIPYFQNKSSILSGFMLPDQSVFVYSAETYGTKGVEDLYVTVKGSDGKWTEPRNLGNVINTPFQELSPSVSADGKTLYFSSNGRKGYGSFDIYASSRLDDTWTNWAAPVNLGGTFNTGGRELYFRPYDQFGYSLFASTTNSDGYGDIKIFLSNEPLPTDSAIIAVKPVVDTVKIVELTRSYEEDKRIRVYGKVTNSKTGESVPAKLTFSSGARSENVASATNGYTIRIASTSDYAVTIEAEGFVSTMEKLDMNTYELKELEMNFRLQPVEVGVTVNLNDVLFEQGKTNLLTQSYPELDLVVSFLKTNPKVKIELAGHTDNRGIPSQNVKLSQARVDKVKAYLVSKGVDGKRISGKGYGGSKPIASNDTEETRQFNRRVEFTIRKF
ncbi:OmpA family protein [Chryseolinea lacunae]|uniref:OmpA family protein n=1 Tax=Chryseolinea lacunae TaxID=2801331 RepID=A0ABS1KWN4_9BACT|nr:OmpA family protein [Chryseolinea lacunae]MBL0743608.1 OmpA family protein [Chryseolinea lacunae]